MDPIEPLTFDTFDAAVASPAPVLVDFWAPWCGPCRAVAPRLDELATTYAGRLRVAKVDVDAEPALAARAGIRSIPTLSLYRAGQLQRQLVGAVPRPQLVAAVEQVLAAVPAPA